MNGLDRFVAHGVVGTLLLGGLIHVPMSQAASLTSLGHNSGAQCLATDVNDAGTAVGTCRPADANGPDVAWVASAATELSLPALASDQSCHANGVTNGGTVIGRCVDASSTGFAVTWNQGPSGVGVVAKLLPRPGVLGLLADVTTLATAYNQYGDVAGISNSANDVSTAVIWRKGSTAAVVVSAAGDNCVPVDIGEPVGAANPSVLLSCPSDAGTAKGVMATPGLLGLYQLTTLANAAGSSFCEAQSMNAAGRIMGTCIFPSAPTSRVAYWVSSATSATVPSLTVNLVPVNSEGAFMNASGNVVLRYQTSDGKSTAAYLAINAAGVATNFIGIPPLHPGTTVLATGFGDNGLVVVEGENDSENAQAAVWDSASPGVPSRVPLYGGGSSHWLSSVSKSGLYAVGTADDTSHVANAVRTTLP